MGFGCPICSEKLDKLPAEAQDRTAGARGGGNEINISATPCGHIFHAYCIQKWLTGNLASSKQCPCCRKDVPRLRCLALFPTSYDESILDDSSSQEGSGGGGGYPVPCNHGEIITSLKNQVTRLENDLKDKDLMYQLLNGDHDTLMEKFRTEKMTSDTWMMRAKQYESYRDVAEDMEARAKRAEERLKTYTTVENMIKGVEQTVNEELPSFPPTVESVRSLLEMKHVMSSELKHLNSKCNELKNKYEEIRGEKMKLKVQYEKKTKEYKELMHIYEISRVNGRIRSPTHSPIKGPSMNDSSTPKQFRTKRRLVDIADRAGGPSHSGASPDLLDSDVDVFPPGFNLKQSKNKPVPPKKFKSREDSSQASTSSATANSGSSNGSSSLSSYPSSSSSSSSKASKFPIALSPISSLPTPPISQEKSQKKKSPDATIDLCSDESVNDMDEGEEFRIRGNVPGAPLPIPANRIRTLQQRSERPILGLSSLSSRTTATSSTTATRKFNFKKPS